MTARARPNLGGLFDGSTPADRTSSVAGRIAPRLVTAPVGRPDEQAPPASPTIEPAEVGESKIADPAEPPPAGGSSQRPIDPLAWLDPIRALELYFGVLQAVLDANRQFVMGLAGTLITGGTRLRSGLDSIRTRP
jgi:hypothetical protein